jgi:hypothetical protein
MAEHPDSNPEFAGGELPPYAALVHRYFEDELLPAEESALAAALDSQPECRQLFTEIATQRAALARLFTNDIAAQRVTDVSSHRTYRLGSFRVWALAASILMVGAIFFGSFTYLAWDMRSKELTHHEFAGNDVTQQSPHDSSSQASDSLVHPGERHKLTSGRIEQQLERGAWLVIEGAADWSVEGDNSISLRVGKVIARVPNQAIGFTIETPTAKVVDLGTEFGVEVSESGSTEVQVLKGKVRLQPGENEKNASQASQPVILSAGEARRIELRGGNGSIVVRDATYTPERFPDRPSAASSTPPKQIRIEGAYASSNCRDLDVSVKYLIGGHGLNGDRHSTNCHHTMWHSGYGEVKGVLVSFDLARPYRLHSMKIWNFNSNANRDNRYTWAGVKQADIYASLSGKGDPLSQPEAWKLVVADQQFAPATGKDDYNTPTIVPLSDVEARFIALIVDEAFGNDPRPEGGGREPDVVGLSEVQLFGQRVEPKVRGK